MARQAPPAFVGPGLPWGRPRAVRSAPGQALALVPAARLFPARLGLALSRAALKENQSVTLVGAFQGVAGAAKQVAFIDWADGTPKTTLALAAGATTFQANHVFANEQAPRVDANGLPAPNDPGPGSYAIQVTVVSAGALDAPLLGAAAVAVQDDPLRGLDLSIASPLNGVLSKDEDTLVLDAAVRDPGPRDWHKLTIDWGDGSPLETQVVAPGRLPSLHHTYPRVGLLPGDLPINTSYTVTVTAADVDNPNATVQAQVTATVTSRPPALNLTVVQGQLGADLLDHVGEGTEVTVEGTVVRPGPAQWVAATIDWGDGSPPEAMTLLSNGAFSARHTYPDNRSLPFTVTASAVAKGYEGEPVGRTTQLVVDNVLPSGLVVRASVPDGSPEGSVVLAGAFTDPGVLDTHRVEIAWGDGTMTVVALAAGTLTFSSGMHTYADKPKAGYSITVRVFDKDNATQTNAAGKVVFGAEVNQNILKSYYDVATVEVANKALDVIFRFVGRIIEVTVARATDFIKKVGNFVQQLKDLEGQFRRLGENFPRVINALLSDPSKFIANLLAGAQQGFKKYFDNLGGNLQGALTKWMSQKLAGFGVTLEDFPGLAASPAQMGGLVLKVMGLTWDDLLAKVTTAIGPANVAAVTAAYNFVSKWAAQQGEMLTAFGELSTKLAGWTDTIDPKKLAQDAVSAGIQYLLTNKLPELVAKKVAAVIAPGVGLFESVLNTATWLGDNLGTILQAVNNLLGQVDNVMAGKLDLVAGAVETGLKAAAEVVLDFAIKQSGLGGWVDGIGKAVGGVRAKIQGQIDAFIKALVDAGKKVAADALTKLGGTSLAGQYAGAVGKVQEFRVGADVHHLWAKADPTGQTVTVMLASTPGALLDAIGAWKGLADGNVDWVAGPVLQAQVTTARSTYTGAAAADAAKVQAALRKLIVDEKAQKDSQDKRQKGTATAGAAIPPVAADVKALAAATAQLDKDLAAGPLVPTPGAPPDSPLMTAVRTVLTTLQARSCFVAGTPLRSPGGAKAIEQFVAGDEVLTRPESGPEEALQVQVVEEVFVREARVLHLHAGGRVVGTTAEHPFWVKGRGWLPAGELRPGDLLSGEDGGWTAVEEVFDTGEVRAVYNLRVANCATYFVGEPGWAFSLWAHNTYYQVGLTQFTASFKATLADAVNAPLKGAPLVASINLNSSDYDKNDLGKYFAKHPGQAVVYLIVDRHPADPSVTVLKVGSTTSTNWKDRLYRNRALALQGPYWRSGWTLPFTGQQLSVYLFAVPATGRNADAGNKALEAKVRVALYGMGQKLPIDFSPANESGQWAAKNTRITSGTGPLSRLQLGQVLAGTTAFATAAPLFKSVDLNAANAEQQLTTLQATSNRWVYLVEARDADVPDRFRILRVGNTDNLVKRATKGETPYMGWAASRYHLTWHVLDVNLLPAEMRAKSLRDIETILREQVVYAKQGADGQPAYLLPEDRSEKSAWRTGNDPMKAELAKKQNSEAVTPGPSVPGMEG